MLKIKNIKMQSNFANIREARGISRNRTLSIAMTLMISITTAINSSRNSFNHILQSQSRMFSSAFGRLNKEAPLRNGMGLMASAPAYMYSSKAMPNKAAIPPSRIRPLPKVEAFLVPALTKAADIFISDDAIKNWLVFWISSGDIMNENDAAIHGGDLAKKNFSSLKAAKDAIEPSILLKKKYIFKQAVIAGRPYISDDALNAAIASVAHISPTSLIFHLVPNAALAAVDAAIRLAILDKVINSSNVDRDIAMKTYNDALASFDAAVARANDAISKIPTDDLASNVAITAANDAIRRIPTTVDDSVAPEFIEATNAAFEKALTAAQVELQKIAIVAAVDVHNVVNITPDRDIEEAIRVISNYCASGSSDAIAQNIAISAARADLISAARDAARAAIDAAIARDVFRNDQLFSGIHNYYDMNRSLPDPTALHRDSADIYSSVINANIAVSDARTRAARAFGVIIKAHAEVIDNVSNPAIQVTDNELGNAIRIINHEAETAYRVVRTAHNIAMEAHDSVMDADK